MEAGARSSSSMSSASAGGVSMGEYAPSPNTCSIALLRANQLRVQTLLRQLLAPAPNNNNNDGSQQQQQSSGNIRQRVDVLRVLRRTLRELDFELSWLTQVDFFETLEIILRDDADQQQVSSNNNAYLVPADSWRLIDDATKLLIEAIPRFRFDIEHQTLANILASVVQNLGHQRSELRRSSLLLINMYLQERPHEFQAFLRLFIEYGLANHRNEQAQRGAILSLPLLMSEQVVRGEDLQPLIRCLCELLVDSANSRLFYSLILALQRLNLTIGDQRFAAYLSGCSPEAMMLYGQAASRNNSLAAVQQYSSPSRRESNSPPSSARQSAEHGKQVVEEEPSKQVTFEADIQRERRASSVATPAPDNNHNNSEDTSQGSLVADIEDEAVGHAEATNEVDPESESDLESEQQITERYNGSDEPQPSSTGQQQQQQRRYYSSVSSTCSSEANLVDPSHYMSEAALHGRPLSGFEQIHHIDHSSTGLAINDMGICCTPTMELGPGAESELKFGIFPRHLVWATLKQGARLSDRLDAMQEIMCIVRDSPINHLAILMTYFDSFLEQFVGRLLEPGTDYKLELCAIDMIETIVIKTKLSTIQYVRPIVNLLARTIGDSRQVFRDNTVRVLHKMMAYLPPQHVLDALFEHKHHRQASVREECVNRVTAAVLEYDKQEFNLTKLCYHVLPMLADHHASVRLAALECIAALAHALGQERIGSLLTAAEAVQTGCDYDGLLDAIHARLMRRTMPRCHSDGSIGYVIKPFLNLANASFHQEHQAADVRWILEAPSSHQHVGMPAAGLPAHQLQHAHHRPGAYSPPPADAQQRQDLRRRSSVSHLVHALSSSSSSATAEADGPHKHHHHHHHHHHQHHPHSYPTATTANNNNNNNQKQQRRETASTTGAEIAAGGNGGQPIASAYRKQSSPAAITADSQNEATTSTKRRMSRPTAGGQVTESEISSNSANKQAASRQSADRNADAPPLSTRNQRQDSASSSDTNKVLFKYYLAKFKQSLDREQSMQANNNAGSAYGAATAVLLPSDSLIYTDTAEAYALSQHQTRQLQTSFDYEPDSVGQIPTGAETGSRSRRRSTTNGKQRKSKHDLKAAVGPSSDLERKMSEAAVPGSPSPGVEQHPQDENNEESIQQQRQEQDVVVQSTQERRKSLARQRASAEMQQQHQSRDRDEEPEVASRTSPQTRPRSNSEKPARPRPTTMTTTKPRRELTRQCASMVADYEHDASEDDIDAGADDGDEEEKQTEERGSASRQSRTSRRASHAPTPGATTTGDESARDARGEQEEREIRRRASRSQPPSRHSTASSRDGGAGGSQREIQAVMEGPLVVESASRPSTQTRRAVSVSPSLACSVNIRHILENVADIEGPFQDPHLALKVSMEALEGPCWSTKVEGMLALIRLASYHQQLVLGHLHEIVSRVANETRNLRSTVARSAIFTLGDFCAKLKRSIEPELDLMVQALLGKSTENTAFIRDDIRRALASMAEHLTQWRLANSLLNHGTNHKSVHARRMASQYVAQLVDRMGAAKCLVGARDISAQLIPASARFAQDNSPHTRYYGRLILSKIMNHGAFERLLRKNLSPNLYRSTIGIVESVKRRGPGEPPSEN